MCLMFWDVYLSHKRWKRSRREFLVNCQGLYHRGNLQEYVQNCYFIVVIRAEKMYLSAWLATSSISGLQQITQCLFSHLENKHSHNIYFIVLIWGARLSILNPVPGTSLMSNKCLAFSLVILLLFPYVSRLIQSITSGNTWEPTMCEAMGLQRIKVSDLRSSSWRRIRKQKQFQKRQVPYTEVKDI